MASRSSVNPSISNPRRLVTKKTLSADLIIEDDIDTELSVAALGGTRWQQQQQQQQQQLQRRRETSSRGGKKRAELNSAAASDLKSLTYGSGTVSNRKENELDTVLFPPVRRGQTGSRVGLQYKPASSSPLQSLMPELPPVPIHNAAASIKKGSENTVIATESTSDVANTAAGAAGPSLKSPPAKLSLDRPWWKSVDRQQQQQLLDSLPPPPPPPQSQKPPTPPPPEPPPQETSLKSDFEAVDLIGPRLTAADAARAKLWTREPITEEQIEALRVAIFSNGDSRFSVDWASQGFHFGFDLIPYLLTSNKSETRSALSAIQGELLRQLLFSKTNSPAPASGDSTDRLKRLSSVQKTAALAAAFHSIVARCGIHLKIVLPNANGLIYVENFSYVKDGISEKLDVYTCQSGCDVTQFLVENSRCFVSQRTPSLVLLIYSCLLTLGVDRPDFKPPAGPSWPLIGPNNLANQSLLSLLLCGSPVARVCNHFSEESMADGSVMKLAGVAQRCDVGWLSSREYSTRRSAQPHLVGSFLKSPRFPIWLLELQPGPGQLMVAFACEAKLVSDWRAERLFELMLLTPDLRTRSPPKVLVDCRGNFTDNDNSSSSSSMESVPDSAASAGQIAEPAADSNETDVASEMSPVEMCLRSKWSGAEITFL